MTRSYTRTLTITGRAAIAYAAAHGLTVSTYTDPTQEGRDGVSLDEAREIAAVDPGLVYVRVPVPLSHAAAQSIEETGADAAADLAALCSGEHTAESLLALCLDGADEDRAEGWREYVSALAAAVETAGA